MSHVSFGQAQKPDAYFPSYEQIKPKGSEIVDYVSLTGSVKTERAAINLYDYPKGTVTYSINGKSSGDVTYVRQLLSDKARHIESITVGKPDPAGKRVISIKYELP
jgi:hypothetical protein